jgi:hypothetical protein
MHRRLTRPFTDAERSLLERWLAERGPPLAPSLLWGTVWFAASLAAWHLAPPFLGTLPAQLLSTGLVALALVHLSVGYARWSRHRSFRAEFHPRCREALEDGRAEVDQVEAAAAVAVADDDAAPATFFFDVGEGRVLYHGDPDVGPVDPRSPWPNDAFEIVRTSRHGLWLGIYATGRSLPRQRRIDPAAIDWDHLPEEDLFDARLESLEGDLRRITEAHGAAPTEDAAGEHSEAQSG